MRSISICLLGVALLFAASCDARLSQPTSIGQEFDVKVYSGGIAVKSYRSTGKVLTESQSDGFYFRDKATGHLVRVSGTVTIEEAR